MLHTIQADFYRLFRSKGFWITELAFLINAIASIVFGIVGGIGINSDSSLENPGGWDGFTALSNLSQNFSLMVMFTIILASIVIGLDISQKLYKNILSYGVSRTQYVLSKSVVIAVLVFFQMVLAYLISFLLASLMNGIGTMPENFFTHFLITLVTQFFCTCAWVSVVVLVLYLTHSILASIFTYFIGVTIISLLALNFPDVDLFFYLNMQFNLSMAGQVDMVLGILLVASAVTALSLLGSLARFRTQDL